MKSNKTYHKDVKVEKNLRKEDIELLKIDREGKIEKVHDKLTTREKGLKQL
jgi:hypothetical protein